MLDKVLQIDQKCEKALIRKCNCFIEQVEYDKANSVVKKLQDQLADSENKAALELEIKNLNAKMNKYSKSEAEFSKNIFGNKEGLYNEKPAAKSKEEEKKEEAIMTELEKIAKKNAEIQEEREYLETLSNIQWFIYPFFKFIEKICEKTCGCCKG
jgi:glycyl-tRNA synthetase beta subunit